MTICCFSLSVKLNNWVFWTKRLIEKLIIKLHNRAQVDESKRNTRVKNKQRYDTEQQKDDIITINLHFCLQKQFQCLSVSFILCLPSPETRAEPPSHRLSSCLVFISTHRTLCFKRIKTQQEINVRVV